MTKNEIVGRLRDGGLDASSTNRSAAVYVADAREGRAAPGWFAYRIICDSDSTERRARAILSRWYDIDVSGNVWRLRSRNRVPLMAIKRGGVPPTPPTPTVDYMYFEAAEANSTVSMMSTLETAPDLEYSTDGVTWQEWQHTTADVTHTFDTLTLTAVGDRVYLRGNNPDGFGEWIQGEQTPRLSVIFREGSLVAGGNVMSLLDITMQLTDVPDYGLAGLFASLGTTDTALITPPDMSSITSVGFYGLANMYGLDVALTNAANMPSLTSIGEYGCSYMYNGCTFNMSDDGTTLNFDFPTPPITAGETTYSTAYDVAQWMGNTNGLTEP